MQQAQTTAQAIRLEMTTPDTDNRPVFVTGNFNNWLPHDKRFQMERIAGTYVFSFPPDWQQPEQLEYKYTRGGWDFVELDENGNSTHNRTLAAGEFAKRDFVPKWRQRNIPFDPAFLPIVHIVSEHFEMPQLKRNRRITALLPHNYHQTDRRYPVLYMQDGQNLFNEESPFGNWAIDQRLAQLAQRGHGDVIVVAIDHGDEERIREFSPYPTPKWGRGEGRRYTHFLAETLKPHIDSTLRTLPDRAHTGIGGSSMGGLISIYAGLMHPETFGRLMVFSPSLWLTPKIYFDAIEFFNPSDTRIYLYGGEKESGSMVPNLNRLKETLEKRGMDYGQLHFQVSVNPKGHHNEAVWGAEFPKAVEWLFY
ncbi:MAG: alpha/beta hydrolase-fold protein [Cytophagales bacterium]|jgi:predicted alpha/beta superfamily hydrolase|nr:alpha/beta hydrolase-fold protein [Cytophagales bacterium]